MDPAPPAQPAPSLLAPGSELAGYRIEALVGRGGMGEVYRARQLSLARTVALKVLSPQLARRDPACVPRFIAEARAAGRFNNPCIVRVHDVGEAAAPPALAAAGIERLAYLSMEFVAGESLQERLKRVRSADADLVARVMRGMAAALAYAEEEGIVHRDVKPDNIMLADDGAVKLADLGLAARFGAGEADSLERDPQGRLRVLGTPLYMSPQQAQGEPIDHRSDQYSLGATLFHMLTGRPPFLGGVRQVMRAQVHEPPPDPADLAPGAPAPWCRLCLRLLAKDPADRFADGASLRAAVEAAAQAGRPPRRRARRIRRRRLLLAASLALGMGIAAWWWPADAAPAPAAPRDVPSADAPAPAAPAPTPSRRHTATPEPGDRAAWTDLLTSLAAPRQGLDYLAVAPAVAAWRARQAGVATDLAAAAAGLGALASRGEGALRALVHAEQPCVDGVHDGRTRPMRLTALAANEVAWEDPGGAEGRQRTPRAACGIIWGPLLDRALLEQAVEPADEVAAAALWLWRDPGRTAAISRIAATPLGRLLAALAEAEQAPP